MINQFIATRIRDNGWSPKTANSTRQVLHRLFVYATKHYGFRARDRRYPNPADGVERQQEAAPEIRFLSLQQVGEQLEALTPNPLMHAMVATYIYAGLRREEAIWLTHEDVNLETRLIHVRAKTINGQFWQPKTKRNRVVPISSALLEILRAYEPPTGSTWYFPSPTGTRWHPDNFSQDLRAANTACGLSWSCLDFRHTFGSHLAQRGEGLPWRARRNRSPDGKPTPARARPLQERPRTRRCNWLSFSYVTLCSTVPTAQPIGLPLNTSIPTGGARRLSAR
jgi:integrase